MELKLTREDLKLDCNNRIWNEVTYADFRSTAQSLILLARRGVFHGNTENNQRIIVLPPFDWESGIIPKVHYVLTLESVEISSKNFINAYINISMSGEDLYPVDLLSLDLLEEDYFVAIKALLKKGRTLRTDLNTQQRGFIDYLRSSRGLDFYTNSCSLAMRVV